MYNIIYISLVPICYKILKFREIRLGVSLHYKLYFNLIVFFGFERLKPHVLHLIPSIYPSAHPPTYLSIHQFTEVFIKP